MKPLYKRIMLKLSGEGLSGGEKTLVSTQVLENLSNQIKQLVEKELEICLVIGGGNIFRGGKEYATWMDRTVADQVGMMATVMNGLFLQEALKNKGIDVKVVSSINVPQVCEPYVYAKAKEHLAQKKVVIFTGGTGNSRFSTDTGAVLRAVEMECDVVLKATQVDGVYEMDPIKHPEAKRYDEISFDEVLKKELKVLDMTAAALAGENNLPILVFSQEKENALVDVVYGKGKFTVIKKER
ncbi:MAG: UMP kinase [Alphaproteobacteria bacterium]|nr:UMP kinase [Alphaproteobacteria bacterium]